MEFEKLLPIIQNGAYAVSVILIIGMIILKREYDKLSTKNDRMVEKLFEIITSTTETVEKNTSATLTSHEIFKSALEHMRRQPS